MASGSSRKTARSLKSKSHSTTRSTVRARAQADPASQFCNVVSAALNRAEPLAISDEMLRKVLGAAIKAYAAKAEAAQSEPLPFDQHSVTATEAVIAACAIIRAVDLNLFDVAMWFRRPVGVRECNTVRGTDDRN